MSRHVSNADKTIRILGFSFYLALVISLISLFFRNIKFSVSLFLVSSIYFIAIFAVLALTKNIHFNILLRRKTLRKADVLYKSEFHIAKLRHFRILFIASIVILAAVAIIYFYQNSPMLALMPIILGVLTYLYFYVHKIHVFALKEGFVFDYGILIVLLRWDEIKGYKIKNNHVILYLKEKNIQRGFHVNNPSQCEKVLKKFLK